MRKTKSNGENDSMQRECAKMNATMREWTVTRENNKKSATIQKTTKWIKYSNVVYLRFIQKHFNADFCVTNGVSIQNVNTL